MNTTEDPATTPTDTRDMLVVHTALLREVRLAPDAVLRAAGTTARRRAGVVRHLRLVLGLLEHHHEGEDRLLVPLLRARVPQAAASVLDAGEAQHAEIEGSISRVRGALEAWAAGDDGAVPGLVEQLTTLHAVLGPHLRAEERDVLPLAATHLSPTEWAAIGEAGSRSVPKSALLTVFGMFMHEGDPDVLREMLAPAPAPVRVLVPRVAPLVYARLRARLHGAPR